MILRPISLRRYARMAKRAGRLISGHDVLYQYDARPKKVLLGTVYGGWVIAPEYIDRGGVMYSFGVGTDISFDLAMIRSFDVQVHGFDPSPHVLDWIATQAIPPKYCFHPYGIAPTDGTCSFFTPRRDGGMYSLHHQHKDVTNNSEALPVFSLETITRTLATSSVDVLKMDIEGAEYDLISSLIGSPVAIKQLLVEFHHRAKVAPLEKTVESVERLRKSGFQLFHVSETSSEFSFLHPLCKK